MTLDERIQVAREYLRSRLAEDRRKLGKLTIEDGLNAINDTANIYADTYETYEQLFNIFKKEIQIL